jgi:hypothetical protein
MLKPRYDEEENISRHAAADRDCCTEMEDRYGWKLLDIEDIGNDILEVDCVFEGKTEFPRPFNETDADWECDENA